nr:GNAT family N-acetyltransferase [Microbacterium invictum]
MAARLGTATEPTLPHHEDIAQWRPATRDDIDAIHAVLAAADAVDHPTWTTPRSEIADDFELEHFDPASDSLLAETVDGTVVASAGAMLHPSREGGELTVYLSGAVHPQWRRRGIGTQLMAWLDTRGRQQLAEAAAADASLTAAELKIFAEEPNTDQQQLADRLGYRAERWFSSMVRDMATPAPALEAPEGITVVEYTHDRDDDARDARNDAFRDHWGSRPSDPQRWKQFVGGEFFRPDLSRIALDADGQIVAFCLASVNEEDWVTLGASNSYIDLIGVIRTHRRRGLAPLVVSRTLQAIADAGLEKAVLDVDTASPTGANTLYEGLGFAATERSIALVTRV